MLPAKISKELDRILRRIVSIGTTWSDDVPSKRLEGQFGSEIQTELFSHVVIYLQRMPEMPRYELLCDIVKECMMRCKRISYLNTIKLCKFMFNDIDGKIKYIPGYNIFSKNEHGKAEYEKFISEFISGDDIRTINQLKGPTFGRIEPNALLLFITDKKGCELGDELKSNRLKHKKLNNQAIWFKVDGDEIELLKGLPVICDYKTEIYKKEGGLQMDTLENHFLDLYREKGFIDKAGKELPVCDVCEYSISCYSGYENTKPNKYNQQWANITLPWIGEFYQEFRIALLGINLYEDGGLNELSCLVQQVKESLRVNNKPRVNFDSTHEYGDKKGKKYAGSCLWHRIAAYSRAIRLALSDSPFDDNDFNSPKSLADEYNNLAFLNHIKCSPVVEKGRSTPTNKMWKNCGKHVLKDELRILKPKWLLVLGSGDNTWALKNHVIGKYNFTECTSLNKIKCFKTYEFGVQTRVFTIPHPAAPGGLSKSFYKDIYDVVKSQ